MNITQALHGKTVKLAHVVDNELRVLCDDGTEVCIAWHDNVPVLVRQNVRVIIPLPEPMVGLAAELGK